MSAGHWDEDRLGARASRVPVSRVRVRVRLGSDPASGLMAMVGYSAMVHVVALVAFVIIPRVIPKGPPPPLILAGEIVSMPAAGLSPAPPASGQQAAASASPSKPARPEPKPTPEKDEPKPPPKPPAPKPRKPEVVPPEPDKPKPEKKAPPEKGSGAESDASEEKQPPGSSHAKAPGASQAPSGPIPQGVGLNAGTGDAGSGIPSITSDVFPYDWYRTTIVNLIRSRWRRPVTPGLPQTLRCVVSFVISRNGALSDVTITMPSGFSALDESAARAVAETNPLPALPYQYTSESVRADLIFELTPD